MILYSIIFLLLSNAITLRRDKAILYSRITIIILLFSSILSLNALFLKCLWKGIGLFGGLFHTTNITQTFHTFIFIISTIILQLTAFYPRKIWTKEHLSLFNNMYYRTKKILNKMAEQYKIIEYPLIILFIISGAILLMTTSDLISIFLSIELQSYGLYILATIYRNSELATSGGLTYFLLGGLSSCFILLGTALIYTNLGVTNLESLYVINQLYLDNSLLFNLNNHFYFIYDKIDQFTLDRVINISLLILSIGFLFKVSAAPFHFWSPDVYDAIPTIVTTFVAIIAKISIFIFFLELVNYTNKFIFYLDMDNISFPWTYSLLLSSLLSLIIGTIVGLTQFRIKRLYAYSTIAHVGFILLGLSINSLESIQAFIFYIIQYSISNLNAFFLLISIGFSTYLFTYKNTNSIKEKKEEVNNNIFNLIENTNFDIHEELKEYTNFDINKNNITHLSSYPNKTEDLDKNANIETLSDKNNSPIQLVEQLKGYYYINPILAISLTITLFSFMGIPPLIGFFAKQLILSAALDKGYIFMVFIGIITSVISAVYYLFIIKQIFFEKPSFKLQKDLNEIVMHNTIYNEVNNHKIKFKLENIALSSYLSITISIITFVILLFIFIPKEWLSIANILALMLFNT